MSVHVTDVIFPLYKKNTIYILNDNQSSLNIYQLLSNVAYCTNITNIKFIPCTHISKIISLIVYSKLLNNLNIQIYI